MERRNPPRMFLFPSPKRFRYVTGWVWGIGVVLLLADQSSRHTLR